jgi:aspartyl protease family protein
VRSAYHRWSAALLLCGLASTCMAGVEKVAVLGLTKDKAVVIVDGKRRVLEVGETSPEGVRLVSASSELAVLEIDGERGTYPLGSRVITANYTSALPRRDRDVTTQIWRSPDGMYKVTGSVDGHPVDFVVDTGSTMVTMNKNMATRMGIDYVKGKPGRSETAGGMIDAYLVKLGKVRVGDIVLENVWAAVLDSDYPHTTLLGMSFLDRLEIRRAGALMELRHLR